MLRSRNLATGGRLLGGFDTVFWSSWFISRGSTILWEAWAASCQVMFRPKQNVYDFRMPTKVGSYRQHDHPLTTCPEVASADNMVKKTREHPFVRGSGGKAGAGRMKF